MTIAQLSALKSIFDTATDATIAAAYAELDRAGLINPAAFVTRNHPAGQSKRHMVWRYAAALPAARIGYGRGGVVLIADSHCQPFVGR